MTQEVAYRFVEALAAVEREGELEPMIDTFAEGCEIGTPARAEKLHGRKGAREFWTMYRSAFRDVHSTLRNIIIGSNSFAVEWTAQAADSSGKALTYDGVSIADTCGDRITRFRSYFDTRHLGEQLERSARVLTAGRG
jgi:ketosteroid isomerase-like protein